MKVICNALLENLVALNFEMCMCPCHGYKCLSDFLRRANTCSSSAIHLVLLVGSACSLAVKRHLVQLEKESIKYIPSIETSLTCHPSSPVLMG